MDIVISFPILVVVIVIQLFLSMKRSRFWGLIVPAVIILEAALSVLALQDKIPSFLGAMLLSDKSTMLSIIVSGLLYLVVSLVIYVLCRKIKNRRQRQIDYVGIRSTAAAKINPDDLLTKKEEESECMGDSKEKN